MSEDKKLIAYDAKNKFKGDPMKNEQRARKILHAVLRPSFGFCLFLSQFTSNRDALFTGNRYLLFWGIFLFTGGILLWITASLHLQNTIKEKEIAISGPFKYIRHPISSIYILSIGLGLIFFSWLWFIVMIVFAPLWFLECKEEEKEMIKFYGQKYIDY